MNKKVSSVWEIKTSAYHVQGVPRFFSKAKLEGVSEWESYFYPKLDDWIIEKLKIPPLKTVRIKITVELLEGKKR